MAKPLARLRVQTEETEKQLLPERPSYFTSLSEGLEVCYHYMSLFMRTLTRTLQQVFEELAYFSSSCEAVKPSEGTTALFGKLGQLVRREILTSDQGHPTSGTLANSMQHTGQFDAAHCICAGGHKDGMSAPEVQMVPFSTCMGSFEPMPYCPRWRREPAGRPKETDLSTLNESWITIAMQFTGMGHKMEISR